MSALSHCLFVCLLLLQCVNQGQYCFLNNMGGDNPDPAAMAKTKFVSSPALLVIKPIPPAHDLPHKLGKLTGVCRWVGVAGRVGVSDTGI